MVTTLRALAASLGGGSLRMGACGAALSKVLNEEVQPAQGTERETLKHAAITAKQTLFYRF